MDRLEQELHLSPRWAILMLVILSVLLIWQSDHPQMEAHRVQMLTAALLIYGASGLAWTTALHRHSAGQWITLGLVWIGIQGIIFLSGFPGTLALVTIPALLALYTLGRYAAVCAAALQSLMAIVAWQNGWLDEPATLAVITSIWITLGFAGLAFHQAWEVASQLRQGYLEARAALYTARERNVILDQTLDDLVHANRQLYLLNERLAALRAHAEEVEASKTTFMIRVSHEFRSPLNMIIGLADLLMDAPAVYGSRMPPPLMEDIRILHRNCVHLAGMINDVLDLSQTEAGRLTLQMDWEDLGQEVYTAAENVSPFFARKGLQLHVNTEDSLPAVYCDRTRVRQVLLNLLTNAGRYTEAGSVTVTAIKVAQMVRISIADTGPGIAREDQARIFEPFYQSTNSAAATGDGSGLGLSICKQFVELHRGRLWLESEVGQGTVFHVELPVTSPAQRIAGADRWLMEEWPWYTRENRGQTPTLPQRLRVVIYDETGQLERYMAYRATEIEWIEVHSIPEAVQAVTTTPAHLLLLNTSSVAALPSLMHQAQATVSETPVVGCAFPAQVEHILRAGAVDYLIKPITRSDLIQAIHAFDEPISRILIVDDDSDFLNLLRRMLHAYDTTLTIITANNGQEALETMAEAQPDLVLLDLMMPLLNGWQVLAQKENNPAIQAIPVIILSSQDPSAELPSTEWITIGWNGGLSIEAALRSALGAAACMVAGKKELLIPLAEISNKYPAPQNVQMERE